MPKTFDLLLGITTVMLLLSLVVTAVTHYLVSLLNLRGRYLRAGLASLFARLDPRLESRHAVRLATAMLKDPLICEAGGRMASFLHRAQLVRLCLGAAADLPEGGDPQSYASAEEALTWTLRSHGIADPNALLDRISQHALELEQSQPRLSELDRLEMAAVSAAGGRFVAKINACFDQTMDRVSARFTTAVRVITVAVALGLALFLQIDCMALINRLGGQLVVPSSHVGGILVTAMLLSLGAPFWFNLLGGALRMRPLTAAAKPPRVIAISSPPASPASSARLPESDEWRPVRESRYSAGRR